ncbi:CubicO group peptidase (beta-lactamase class C family) [Saccharomonospora amisosensis]|uniref:CubicO group peptidase (Beta-lactamase class C family) n=1 Tax=Saccharomonospora amisosensis TaxID=1128677 RepID=A0A7X5ZQM1_9PSEU|nr:serine hydrolase domain-containing protein [Saccharomonospora amisosensis]NIJ11993.1 CubicO group peptidase (beta-lactamase class C family) [Saccharomonospora amisosensis]
MAVGELLNRRPTVGFAVGVVRDGDLEFFHGHGTADIASGAPITQDTVFRVASITKTFTAVAVLQLAERGLVDLDTPANDYLRGFRLVSPSSDWPPATVRHLLTHTSGVPETVHASRSLKYVFGESVALTQPLPTLADYYRGGLRLVARPGSGFTYTDHNFATLGQLVEDVSGQRLDSYFHEHVFQPLGMTSTDLLRSDRIRPHLATGYTIGRRGPKPVTDRQWIAAAASSIYSSPRDMARYLAALLGGGANQHGRVLSPVTLATMFQPQYQPDPRIPGMGLAFSRFDLGGHVAVEHEGILPGFNSDIFLAPDDGVGVLAFTNGARQAMLWLPAEVGRLLGDLIGAREERVRTDVAQRPDLWGELCGRYPFPAPLTDLRARSMFGAGAEVFVRRGALTVRLLSPVPAAYRGFTLHPDDENDPYAFRIDLENYGIGTARVVFAPDPDTGRTALLFELFPTTLRRRVGPQSPGGRVARALRSAALTARARRSNQAPGGG